MVAVSGVPPGQVGRDGAESGAVRGDPLRLAAVPDAGQGGAELDRLRAELEELLGKPVQLNMFKYDGPPEGRKEIKIGPELTAD